MNLRTVLPLTLMFAAVAAFGADAAGTWKGIMNTREGGKIDVSLTLKADAETLTGAIIQGKSPARTIENGKVSGDKISFEMTYTGATPAETRKVNFTGTVDGNHLKMTAIREGATRGNEYALDRQ